MSAAFDQAFLNEVAQKGYAAISSAVTSAVEVVPVVESNEPSASEPVTVTAAAAAAAAAGSIATSQSAKTPYDGALQLIVRNIPVTPLRPNSKIAFLPNWDDLATTDATQVARWNEQYPGSNWAAVAKAQEGGIWIFEADNSNVILAIEQETGQKIPRTFRVRSSPGRGHSYFKQTARSIAMGNRQATGADGKELWSARVSNRYCVAAFSVHPTTGKQYEILSTAEIVEAPEWLVEYCIKHSNEKKTESPTDVDPKAKIISGNRNNSLTSIAGVYRNRGMNAEEIYTLLSAINDERCDPPLDDEEVISISQSVARYKIPPPEPKLLFGGKPSTASAQQVEVQVQTPASATDVEADEITLIPYPKFPAWVMNGTSIYDNFVKPVCDVNSRVPEFMFLPAMTLLLNYVGRQVRIQGNTELIPNLYTVLVGKRGIIKSSCIDDAMIYFSQMDCLTSPSAIALTEKSLFWTPGSAEGLGLEMQRTKCQHAVLYYDELSQLVAKTGIESSSLSSALLTLYESKQFQNSISQRGKNYAIDSGTYSMSLLASCTTKSFRDIWSKLAYGYDGMADRFTFVLEPENPPDKTIKTDAVTKPGVTRKLIDKAITKGVYEIDDKIPLTESLKQLTGREELRAEKYALFFSIDLNKDSIDEDCIERALALVDYEQAVKKYLRTTDGDSRQAILQIKARETLERAPGGKLRLRELERTLNTQRSSTYDWGTALNGLIGAGIVQVTGNGTRSDPKVVQLMRVMDSDD